MTVQLHPQQCTNCKIGITAGYHVAGEDYYCSDECFIKNDEVTWDEYQIDIGPGGAYVDEGGTDEIYWTDWEIDNIDNPVYDSNGIEYSLNGTQQKENT